MLTEIFCCQIQTNLRYEFLQNGIYHFDVAELEIHTDLLDWSICFPWETDPKKECQKNFALGHFWTIHSLKGSPIACFRTEIGGSAGETSVDRFNKPTGWKGNSLHWWDPNTGFKISLNVKLIG